jgi:hypothetical protein
VGQAAEAPQCQEGVHALPDPAPPGIAEEQTEKFGFGKAGPLTALEQKRPTVGGDSGKVRSKRNRNLLGFWTENSPRLHE